LQRIEPAEDVVCAELEGEAVLLDVGRGIYFGLDEVGYRIWTLLGAGQDAPGIAATLLAEYDAPPADIRADVDAFLDTLLAGGLARRTSQAA
jgi:hypothetical protein